MYLKRMEIAGFKSFADRTELEFVPGVTAVVGPNGSGKSNISDSIRWVLGEQSAKSLRGAKMEDVIFAGSDTRKPVNYCEVTLTLDNADRKLDLDYSEVTITRRVYRTGDSEYMINKQSCRLKDIHELFMDTGLGKEAYSIIGQGKIEEILSTKAEDRRGIFEEAAGIVKYKTRKREAVKKLEETEGNLLRIGDIIAELEEQIGPLSEQAEIAKTYQGLKADLQNTEIGLYVYEIGELHSKWTSSKQEFEALEKSRIEVSGQVSTLEAKLATLKWQAEQLEQQLDQCQQGHLEIVTEVEKVEGRKEVLLERGRNLLLGREEAIASRNRTEKEIGQLQATSEANMQKLAELQRQIQVLKEELRQKTKTAEGVQARLVKEETLESMKSELIEHLNQAASRKNERNHLAQQAEMLARRIDKFEQEQNELTTRIGNMQKEILDKETIVARLQAEIQSLEEQRQKDHLLMQNSREQQRAYEQNLQQLQNQQSSVRSRLDLLKDMQHEYGGYMQGVKTVLQASGTALKGIRGAVAELFQVPKEYEIAVETALGGALQNIVVDNEKAGRDAIDLLKRKGGRATFMPLDVVKGRSLSSADKQLLANGQGFIGIASDLVQSSGSYQSILENLLGQVILANSLMDANALAKRIGYRYRIVTLEGDIVNPGGTMTGGSVQRKGTSLLGRQREIEELEQKTAALRGQIQNLMQDRQAYDRKLLDLEGVRAQMDEQIKELREQERTVSTQLHEKQIELRTLQERNSATDLELNQCRNDQQVLGQRDQETNEMLTSLTDTTEQIQKQIQDLQNELRQEQMEAEDMNEEVTEVRVQLASLEQADLSVKQQNIELKERIQTLQLDMESREQEFAAIEQRLVTNKQELTDVQASIERFAEQKQLSQAAVDELKTQKADKAREIAEHEHLVKEARLSLKQLEQQMHQIEVRINRLDVELSNVLNKLAEEYQLTYELAKERYAVPEDLNQAKQFVRAVRKQMDDLGDVNIGAIEEFARVSERFEFLRTQKQDLTDAKEKLYEVIAEINAEMSKRFVQTFDAIREQFTVAFVELFGGGRADLLLSDPEDILVTGIDIVAQPPGKKLQNLALLSGGERALTAMALLFAILRIKPVPFCVLDEVEAALDEANVSRFAEYLHEFSAMTQFIVITHRKGTMEGADVLYGVTMQESGVSKLMSVKLSDHQLETAS